MFGGISIIGFTAKESVLIETAFARTKIKEIKESNHSKFDPKKGYGNAVLISNKKLAFDDRIKEILMDDVIGNIPPSYRKHVKFFVKFSDDPLGEYNAIGWKYYRV